MKYEREGYFVTVDIEKGMQDGQVRSPHFLISENDTILKSIEEHSTPACTSIFRSSCLRLYIPIVSKTYMFTSKIQLYLLINYPKPAFVP